MFSPLYGGRTALFFLVSSEKQIGRRLLSQDALVTAGRRLDCGLDHPGEEEPLDEA